MSISEETIREITIKGIKELGDKATPESVKQYVENELSKFGNNVIKPSNSSSNRVILTSFGLNHMGIVSNITKVLSECKCDILDISQKIMQEFYTMIMMIDISNCNKELKELQEELSAAADKLNVKIYLQHEDVFRFMHRI